MFELEVTTRSPMGYKTYTMDVDCRGQYTLEEYCSNLAKLLENHSHIHGKLHDTSRTRVMIPVSDIIDIKITEVER